MDVSSPRAASHPAGNSPSRMSVRNVEVWRRPVLVLGLGPRRSPTCGTPTILSRSGSGACSCRPTAGCNLCSLPAARSSYRLARQFASSTNNTLACKWAAGTAWTSRLRLLVSTPAIRRVVGVLVVQQSGIAAPHTLLRPIKACTVENLAANACMCQTLYILN